MMSKNKLSFGKIVKFLVGGILVGVANGLFGGGGGMLCVPLLLLAGLDNQKAQATAILIMTPISIASVIVYYTSGYIDITNAIFVGVGSIVDHDVNIGEYAHINAGAICKGGAIIDSETKLEAGEVVHGFN